MRKSPPERKCFHFKAMLRHPSSSASCFYSFISLSFSSAEIKPLLVVVTPSRGFFHLLSSGIQGLDCSGVSRKHPATLLRSSWGGSICCKAEWDIQSNPSSEFRVSPLTCSRTPPEGELLIRDLNRPNCTLRSIWMSQLVLDSRPPC